MKWTRFLVHWNLDTNPFAPQYRQQTLDFMKAEKWIHSICDEPQSGEGSIPTVLEVIDPEKLLIRFHGRNVYGWQKRNADNWREVRYFIVIIIRNSRIGQIPSKN